jgi:signal transduction histidine kinase
VRDNGIGLDERQQARVFQLYHRSPTQEVAGVQQEGHGVGLAIVKRIVERYGGVITVQSAPQGGTIFEVTLPRGEDGGVPEARASMGVASAGTRI